MKRYFAAAVLCLTVSQVANAGALADQKKWAPVDDKIKASVDSAATTDHCGGPVTATVDKASFSGDDDRIRSAAWCSAAVNAIGSFCHSNPEHKKEVLAAVNSVTCHYDASLKGTSSDTHWGVKVVKKGTQLDVSYNEKSSNVESETKKVLDKEL